MSTVEVARLDVELTDDAHEPWVPTCGVNLSSDSGSSLYRLTCRSEWVQLFLYHAATASSCSGEIDPSNETRTDAHQRGVGSRRQRSCVTRLRSLGHADRRQDPAGNHDDRPDAGRAEVHERLEVELDGSMHGNHRAPEDDRDH